MSSRVKRTTTSAALAVMLLVSGVARADQAADHYNQAVQFKREGKINEAIAECQKAIVVDPDFGNPYNDIGAYLIELGRHTEAVAWLERAKRAPRYEPRHYPYFNLARVYVKDNRLHDAIRELRGALRVEPRYEVARKELVRLELLVRVLN